MFATAQSVKLLCYNPEGRNFDSRKVSLEYFIEIIFRPHYGIGIESASKRNEHREHLLGVKVAGA
jgi:hypothetical protein